MTANSPATPDAVDARSATDLAAEVVDLRGQLVDMARLADAIPHIVWTMSTDGTPTYFNAKWTEYTALDLAETLRVGASSFVHPADLPRFEQAIKIAGDNGAPFEAAYRLRRAKDNVYCWHEARVVPLRQEDGRVTAWIATATNVDDQRNTADEQHYLVAASKVLGTSLDLKQTLNDVAKLLVPHMADWCAIDLLADSGLLDRQAVAHVDPTKVALAWDLWKRVPPKPEDPHGVYGVIRTGQADVMTEITDEFLASATPDPEILALLRSLGLRSSMCVPLVVRDRVFGALTLVSSESGKLYGARDLAFARELARRIGVAVDNARLYGVAEQARLAAEAIAADVVEQSRAVEQALIAMREERDAALKQLAAGGAAAAAAAGKV